MPLIRLKPLLEDAQKKKYALGSFNVFNIETFEGLMEAAVELKTPIICAVYEPHMKYGDLEAFADFVKEKSTKVDVPVVLHLDHAETMSSIVNAIRCGFTSVMFDGPAGMDFEEKIEQTREVVKIAHSIDITVEAELDYIVRAGIDEKPGKKDVTDPDTAREFVERTGIDILAPAIGNVHGKDQGTTGLNLDLLKEIKAKTGCYISLHGGSGVADSIIREAIDLGLNKVSVYTRISNLAVEKIKYLLETETRWLDLAVVQNEVRNAFSELITDRLEAIRSKNIIQ
ncbi:MAG: class II fructose-bisphosphate aldolase [Armatimonadota bacterium]